MYTVNAREPMYYPQDIAMAAKIFTVAEEDWTMPSTGWDDTNLAMFAGDKALGGQIVKNMYTKALELGSRRSQSPNAGTPTGRLFSKAHTC